MSDEPLQPVTPDDEHWEALARYVAGECPPAEAAAIRRWLDEEPGREQMLTALARVTDRLAFAAPPVDVDAALARVTERLAGDDVRPIEATWSPQDASRGRTERGRSGWRTIGLRAAALVALLGGVVVWRVVSGGDGANVAVAQAWETAAGQTDTVYLSDGTTVLLGPLTRLAASAGYDATGRNVELYGEALFDVTHDDAQPFTVRAGHAEIVDLGTTFTVRSVEAEAVQVAVTAGSVILRTTTPSDSGVVLRAGDRGILEPGGRPVALSAGASDVDLGWTEGRLVFENMPLQRVATELRRWYGVVVDVPDAMLAARPITATFRGEPIDEVLRVIELATGTRMERQGDTVFVRPAGALR
jgi:transmembrane sensor